MPKPLAVPRETCTQSQTPDEQHSECIFNALRATGLPPLRNVQVIVHEGYVVLKGRVRTYYMKQMAQCAAMSVRGVGELRNEFEVV